ncbi:winged helix-turn-helix transcriptional regulator [Thauera linaloolentis]|uniref:Putative transcriptional regulator n=1 Tax=Thauera linaloolentis (strain DSM 12138 / JCM 21573 / CCUG 41526 / CIP 105981 / IAM 15112 / NBRC 102519 / 47Lol) TaxID=1123367 RepID=N6Y335_THAL4|nr:helix-turn-helix domain-containing protein [Thauera linaloolentis]ENO88621.1 putative transcriptional regulator [Thauera linaloolentis 47Lol = DSM 12138]MCM8565666.1 helix-turn-helix transcriptional regulator [Thauera linaloolentis]
MKNMAKTPHGGADPALRGITLEQQMARGNLMAATCPSRDVLRHLTSRWGVLVLIALSGKTCRFSELRHAINGVSERMLAQTLQWLEGDGMVLRKAYPVVPPHVEYSLTPLGREAAEKVVALADWVEINWPRIALAQQEDGRR